MILDYRNTHRATNRVCALRSGAYGIGYDTELTSAIKHWRARIRLSMRNKGVAEYQSPPGFNGIMW